jgi:23S rRNA pseudouridine2605 synthase
MPMRINQYLASATNLSRRAADLAIQDGRVVINGQAANLGQMVAEGDEVKLDDLIVQPAGRQTILFYKPVGVVCSRRKQGNSSTIYDVLPAELSSLNPVGRLDKDTSGLLILTNDGWLHQQLSHPSWGKVKVYEVELDRPIEPQDLAVLRQGVNLEEGKSLPHVLSATGKNIQLELSEGRNRQVRRTFAALGYTVIRLHRPQLSNLELGNLKPGEWRVLDPQELSQ